jgi:geranylgeranyl diphosphate synthase type II
MQSLDTIANLKKDVENALQGFSQSRYGGSDPLSRAVRYALEGEGKRVRPILCLLAAKAICNTRFHPGDVMPAALALEMVHTYSLVHDDLPTMDNDDLRRGRPTVHKVFDEAEALLAGDSLLTDAFGVLAAPESYMGVASSLPPSIRVRMIAELAQAAGGQGMVLGQSQDLYWTGRSGAQADHLTFIHLRKTGRLLGAAAALGAMSQDASEDQVRAFRTFGEQLGLAFQITDDLLDDSIATGKSAGKDSATGKLTYLSHMGRSEAKTEAELATSKSLAALTAAGVPSHRGDDLAAFAKLLLQRTA